MFRLGYSASRIGEMHKKSYGYTKLFIGFFLILLGFLMILSASGFIAFHVDIV
jgi:hypothetical protein